MPEVALDDRTIRRLVAAGVPPGADRVEYSDKLMPGLRLRVTGSGRATWSLVFRIKGRAGQLRKTFGPFPRLSLAEARAQARIDLNRAVLGEDPRAQQAPAELSFGGLVDLWKAHVQEHNRSWRQEWLRVEKDLLPRWSARPAKSIVKADVLALKSEVADRGASVYPNLVQTVSAIFSWAYSEDLVDTNPAHRVKRARHGKPGDRWLTDAEIRAVLLGLQNEKRAVFASVLISRILLGQRTAETVTQEWADTDDDWWSLSPEVTKNKWPHRVFLPPLYRELVLDRLASLTGGSRWIFASTRKDGHVHPLAVTAYCNDFSTRIGIPFDARDLRRTYVTHLARLGVARETRQQLVNHRGGLDVIDIHYDVYDYDEEKKAASLRWEAHLRNLLEGESAARVLPMRA